MKRVIKILFIAVLAVNILNSPNAAGSGDLRWPDQNIITFRFYEGPNSDNRLTSAEKASACITAFNFRFLNQFRTQGEAIFRRAKVFSEHPKFDVRFKFQRVERVRRFMNDGLLPVIQIIYKPSPDHAPIELASFSHPFMVLPNPTAQSLYWSNDSAERSTLCSDKLDAMDRRFMEFYGDGMHALEEAVNTVDQVDVIARRRNLAPQEQYAVANLFLVQASRVTAAATISHMAYLCRTQQHSMFNAYCKQLSREILSADTLLDINNLPQFRPE